MPTSTEIFINSELPKRPYTNQFPLTLGHVPVATGVGLQVEARALTTSDISGMSSYATQVDLSNVLAGLWDDRGAYTVNAAGNINYPSSAGSGVAGALMKGDIFTVAGAVAGISTINNIAVNNGDTVRALVDNPSATDNAHWAIAENNIGYVPENRANKTTNTDLSGATGTYPDTPTVKTYIDNYDISAASINSTGTVTLTRTESDLTFQVPTAVSGLSFDPNTGILTSSYTNNATSTTITVAANEVSDNVFRIKDNDDATKKIAFEASGIATGETRTITMPNVNVDLGKVSQAVTASTDGYFTSSDYLNVTKKVFITSTSTYTVSGNDAQRDHEFILTSNASINIHSLASNKRAVFRSGDGSTYTISNATATSWLFSGISGATVQVSQTQDVYISGNLSSSHVGYITGSRVNTSHFQIAGTGTATFNIPTVGNSVITVPSYNVNLGNIPFLNVSAASPITNGGINHIVIPVGAFGVSIPITYGATTSNTKYIVYNNTVSNMPVSLAIAWSGQTAGFSAATYIGYSDQSVTQLSDITGISGTYNTPTIVNVPPGGSVELIMYGTGGGSTRVNVGITTNTGGLSTYNQWLKIYKSYATADASKYMWVDGSALTTTRQLTLPDSDVNLGNVLPVSAYRYVIRDKTTGFTLDSTEITNAKGVGGNFITGNIIYNVAATTDVSITLGSPSALGLSVGDSFTIRQADFGIVTVQGTVNGSTTGYHSTFGVGDSFTLIAYSTTAWLRMG